MHRTAHLLLLALGLAAAATTAAQTANRRSELTLGVGGMSYMGDLNNQHLIAMPGLAANLGVRYRIDNRWAWHLDATYGTISGGNPDYIERRNLSFQSVVAELSYAVEFTFWSFGAGQTDHTWAPYLFAGLGLFYFNPTATYTMDDGTTATVDLQPLHTEGQGSAAYPDRQPYSRLQMCIPFGIGVKWRLNKTFTVSAEYGLRYTWTDYLDDVSTTYVTPDVLRSTGADGELAIRMADRSGEVEPGYTNAPGIKRGDDSLNDLYTSFHINIGISLETLFGWAHKKRCKL